MSNRWAKVTDRHFTAAAVADAVTLTRKAGVLGGTPVQVETVVITFSTEAAATLFAAAVTRADSGDGVIRIDAPIA